MCLLLTHPYYYYRFILRRFLSSPLKEENFARGKFRGRKISRVKKDKNFEFREQHGREDFARSKFRESVNL